MGDNSSGRKPHHQEQEHPAHQNNVEDEGIVSHPTHRYFYTYIKIYLLPPHNQDFSANINIRKPTA